MQGTSTQRRQIAVVGSGIGGLSAAWLLSSQHDVTIIEQASTIGMDQASINLPSGQRIDAPPRTFSKEFYPTLSRVYGDAGVAVAPWSWANSAAKDDDRAYLIQDRSYVFGIPYPVPAMSVKSWVRLLGQFGVSTFWDGYHFGKTGEVDRADPVMADMPLGDYIKLRGYGEGFVQGFLLPMLSMVCGCSYDHLHQYPAGVILEFWSSTGYGNQFHAKHGSSDVGAKLTRHCKDVLLGASVAAVRPGDAHTGRRAVVVYTHQGRTVERAFDDVIMATDARTAVRIVQHAKQLDTLKKFKYVSAGVAIHRCPKLMPADRADWSPMNMVSRPDMTASMFTMWLSHPGVVEPPFSAADTADGEIFQTWNPFMDKMTEEEKADPRLLLSHFDTIRSLVTPSTKQHCRDLHALQGAGGIYYVGAYVNYEVPLLENAVKSAVHVAAQLGIVRPDLATSKEKYDVTRNPGLAGSLRASQGLWALAAAATVVGALYSRARL